MHFIRLEYRSRGEDCVETPAVLVAKESQFLVCAVNVDLHETPTVPEMLEAKSSFIIRKDGTVKRNPWNWKTSPMEIE